VIWLVTTGCYSDYRVLGVFDDKEKAERFSLLMASENELEEFELNPEAPNLGGLAYVVRMDRGGNTTRYRPIFRVSNEMYLSHYKDRPSADMRDMAENKPYRWLPVVADNEEGAIKIANEHRVRKILSGEWPEVDV